MSFYLIQHITNTKATINLVTAFYSKLIEILNNKVINFWVNAKKNSVFYLIKSSDKNEIEHLYIKFPDFYPDKITLVNNHLVCAFLKSEQKLKKIRSIPFFKREKHAVFFVVKIPKHIFYNHLTDDELSHRKVTIKKIVSSCKGCVIASVKEDLIASFISYKKAISCAALIVDKLKDKVSLKIILHPCLYKNNNLFIRLIDNLISYSYFIKTTKQLVLFSDKKNYTENQENVHWLRMEEKTFLFSLIDLLSENYRNPKFSVSEISSLMMMCKTKLYKKSKIITGKSTNQLLKDFRLLKSIDLIMEGGLTINQISTDIGFSSNSYFSNCFKKKFGFSPKELLKKNSLKICI